MDKWVRQLNEEQHGITEHPTALTPDQRKIKELEKKIRNIKEKKEILHGAL